MKIEDLRIRMKVRPTKEFLDELQEGMDPLDEEYDTYPLPACTVIAVYLRQQPECEVVELFTIVDERGRRWDEQEPRDFEEVK